MNQTLYERLGGEKAVKSTVIRMYDKILEDDLLAPFFENIDVEKLRLSQTAFVTYAFGGPNHYTGQSMRSAHQRSTQNGLGDAHFDRVAAHLKATMEELHVPAPLISEALAIVESTRADVLNR